MNRSEFQNGYLIYDVKIVSDPMYILPVLKEHWYEGYVAFSKGEMRWSSFVQNFSGEWDKLLEGRHSLKGVEGYIMEINLWRDEAGIIYEEFSLEREDNGFFSQRFQLHTDKDTVGERKAMECYYRYCKNAFTITRSKPLFKTGDLNFIEIVVPDFRLNIFLTTRG